MRVLILSAGADTGGVAIGLANALNRHTDWEARSVTREDNYLAYPQDIFWPLGEPMPSGLEDLAQAADVLHVMERWQAVAWYEAFPEKPLVLHHHGAIFRANRAPLVRSAQELRAVSIVSTPDLCLLDKSAEWLPNSCDIGRMQEWAPSWHRAPSLIGHSPTSHAWKGTDAFVKAAETIGAQYDVIEKVSWYECLRRKAKCDVLFDQFYIGYALASIEAWAMGIPTVAGAVDPRLMAMGIPGGAHLAEILARRFGYLPFLLAEEATLADRLREIMTDIYLWQRMRDVGTYHLERYHDEAKVAHQLVGIYERARALR